MPPARINVAVPNYGSQVRSVFMRSLYPLLDVALAQQASFVFSEIDYPDIEVARNYLVSNFYYNKPECTHLLMLDNDMGFGPELIRDMVAFDRPVVGVVYPTRGLDLRRLHAMGHLPFEKALARSLDYVGQIREPRSVSGDFIRMNACGTGILLVSRACIERMVAVIPEAVDESAFKAHSFAERLPRYLRLFEKIRTPDEDYSEDMSFCRRWVVQCNGEIWASFRHKVSHVGTLIVQVALSDS